MAFLGSTELIGLEHNQALDDLPETNSNFCTVKVNDSVLIYTGGLGSSFVISKAMYMKGSLGQDWIRDQDMWQARLAHMCGVLNIDGKSYLVVTGGTDFNQVLKSTEVMDLSLDDKHWIPGPDLPDPFMSGTMISSPRQDALYVLGGGNQDEQNRKTFNDKIFKLSCSNGIGSCHWMKVPKH